MNLKVGVLQFDIQWHKPQENIERIERHIEGLKGGIDLWVLPEMFTTGFTKENHLFQEEPLSTLERMKFWAKSYHALMVGSIIYYEQGNYRNRLLAVFPDGSFHFYDKRHLFTMANEHQFYQPGKARLLFEYKGWRICPLICFDLRFPVWSRNLLKSTEQSYDIAIYVANWPKVRIEHWNVLLKARAIENQCFVIGCNRVGIDGYQIEYNGNSAVYDFEGKTLAFNDGQEKILFAELNYGDLQAYRKKFPAYWSADDFVLVEPS